jgi:hypothetical protein
LLRKFAQEIVMAALSDPVRKYPAPPFKRQLQPWPGLAGKMEPPPHHGERSYRGSGRLMGTKGIPVNGVASGPIWTPLQVSGGASMEQLEKFSGETVFKRRDQPVELASIHVQLAADDASSYDRPDLWIFGRWRPAVTKGMARFCTAFAAVMASDLRGVHE